MTPAPYPTPPPVEVDPVAEADLGAHAALVTGVHGVPAFTTGVDDGKGLIWGNGGWQKSATPLVTTADLATAPTLAPTTSTRNQVVPASGVTALTFVAQGANAWSVKNAVAGSVLTSVDANGVLRSWNGGALLNTTGDNVLVAQAATHRALILKLAAGASVDAMQIQASDGSVIGSIAPAGQINIGTGAFNLLRSKDSAINRANLNSGTVSMEVQNNLGTTATPLVVKGFAGQTADLFQVQDNAGGIGALITAGMALKANTVVAGSTTAPGNVAKLFTGATSAGDIPLVARGFAGQTGDLFRAQDATPTTLMKVRSDGFVGAPGFGPVSGVGPYLWHDAAQGWRLGTSGATEKGLVLRGFTGQTGDLLQAQDVNSVVLARINSQGNLTANYLTAPFLDADATGPYLQMQGGKPLFIARAGTNTPLAVRAAASQTVDMFQLQDSGGGVRSSFGSTGNLGIRTFPSADTLSAFANGSSANARAITARANAASPAADITAWQSAAGVDLLTVNAAGQLAIFNSVAPATPTLGGIIYVAAGALRFKGSAGTDTLIANA